MIRRGGLDGLPWVRMGGGLGPREEREEQGRLKLMGFSQVDAYWATTRLRLHYVDGPGKMLRRHSRGDGLSSPSVELVLAIVFRYQHISGSIKMKPTIDETSFGSITIEGKAFEYDVLIRMNGEIEKRKKKLSKAIYGTSHVLSLDEAKYVYEKGTKRLIIGSGQDGNVELSNEAAEYFESKHCKVDLWPTPKAIGAWNKAEGDVIGLFHVTC